MHAPMTDVTDVTAESPVFKAPRPNFAAKNVAATDEENATPRYRRANRAERRAMVKHHKPLYRPRGRAGRAA